MAVVKVDSNGVPFWEQRNSSHLDYTLDWRVYLTALTDTVASAVWSTVTSGLTLSSASFTTSGVHTVWVTPSAGNVGNAYILRSKIFTAEGRIDPLDIKIVVVA